MKTGGCVAKLQHVTENENPSSFMYKRKSIYGRVHARRIRIVDRCLVVATLREPNRLAAQ